MHHSSPSASCQHALLSRNALGQVSICPDCGVVHLSLQSLTVRLELDAFAALTRMLAEAQRQLHGAPTPDLAGQRPHSVTAH